MKKTIYLCMLVIVLLLISSCKSSKVDIHDANKEICLIMEEKAKSEDYWQLYISGTYRSYEEERKKYMANDYDQPIRCYKIQITDIEKAKEKIMFAEEKDREHYDNLPAFLQQDIENAYCSNDFVLMKNIANRITLYGSNYEFHSHICNTSKALENTKLDDAATAYLYIFETGKPIIIVCGYESESSGVAYGMFMMNSEYKTLSETRDVFEPYGCSVEIEFDN